MATVTESVGRPANPDLGDFWIRLPARTVHEWVGDPLGWLGYVPQAGANTFHLAKRTAQDYDSTWVDPISGMVTVHNQTSPWNSWMVNHRLAFQFVDVLVVKADDDWTWNGTLWTDPQAVTRRPTIMVPRITYVNANFVQLDFETMVRGVAVCRR